ncbi:uncharacterized protein Obp99b [Prorops nasuta]|uniref:uncharacterized protein Obp99b n=1 Tax=Prorops nasuta TaxID=863751 RepID=UPI0034CEA414
MNNLVIISCVVLFAIIVHAEEGENEDSSAENLPRPPHHGPHHHHFPLDSECMEKVGLIQDELQLVSHVGNEMSRPTACYISCTLEKKGFLENGVLLENKIEEYVVEHSPPAPEVREEVKKDALECREKGASAEGDACDKTKELVTCMHEKMRSRGPPGRKGPRGPE